MNRLRAGEWIAAAGAIGLLVVLPLNWFALDGLALGWASYTPLDAPASTVHQSGWAGLGWFMVLLIAIAIVGGLSLSYMTAKRTSPAWPVGTAVLTWSLGTLIFLVLLVRVTLWQPDLGGHWSRHAVSVELPAYLGLLFAALIPLGGFASLKDERKDTAEARAYTPPPARSVPGT